MPLRRPLLIAACLAVPALSGCGKEDAGPPPASAEARAAIKGNPGVGREKLGRAIDAVFDAGAVGDTRALIVMHEGRIVAERYAERFGPETRQVSWSMAKTITAVLIGLLVSDGRLRLDESAPVPVWQRPGDPRGEITLRQLLQMRSGLRHTEAGDPVYQSDEVRMLFLDGRDDMAAYAEAQPLEAEPGTKHEYSSATTVILSDIATRALTDSNDPGVRARILADYLRTRLFEPIGMKSMIPEFDAKGTLIGGSLIHGTARDWAKFGEFLRNDGVVRGTQVVPRAWMDFMRTSSPRNPGYGAQLWLNRPQSDDSTGLFPGKAPASVVACVGHLGQYVIASPQQRLTVVRLGHTPGEQRPELVKRLGVLVRMFPAAK